MTLPWQCTGKHCFAKCNNFLPRKSHDLGPPPSLLFTIGSSSFFPASISETKVMKTSLPGIYLKFSNHHWLTYTCFHNVRSTSGFHKVKRALLCQTQKWTKPKKSTNIQALLYASLFYTPFYFNIPYKFTSILNVQPLNFSLTQFWLAAFYNTNPSFLMGVSFFIYAYPFQEHN